MALQYFFFKKLVKYADAAVLNHQIALSGLRQQCRNIIGVLIDNALDIGKITGITFLLAAIGIRFGKGNLMAERMELLVNTAVIRGRAVPVRRCNAGTKN